MKWKEENGLIFVRLDDGEDFFETLYEVLREARVSSAVIVGGIGMLRDFEIGWFNVERGEYERESTSIPHELLSAQGNVSELDGKAVAHIHVALAGPSRSAVGGHLFKATVCNTVELFLFKTQMRLFRRDTGQFKQLNV